MSKPICKLVGTDGNVFSIIGRVVQTLERAGLRDEARDFENKAFDCESYNAVLVLVCKYVTVQ